jgi:D-sedoheptulose 7-phosphate isomerase
LRPAFAKVVCYLPSGELPKSRTLWGTGVTNFADNLRFNLEASIKVKSQLLAQREPVDAFARLVDAVIACYRRQGRLYIAGNGGSASDAQHLAGEFVCKLSAPRPSLAAEALAADVATLTAIANDFSYDNIFARQLESKATPKDLFLAITTSGNSPNIIRALKQCRESRVPSALLSGRDGGAAKDLADISVIVPGETTCQIQEVHLIVYHTLVGCVEAALFDLGPPEDVARP